MSLSLAEVPPCRLYFSDIPPNEQFQPKLDPDLCTPNTHSSFSVLAVNAVTVCAEGSVLVMQMAQQRRAAPKFAKAAFADGGTSDAWAKIPRTPRQGGADSLGREDEILPSKGPARTTSAVVEVERPPWRLDNDVLECQIQRPAINRL